MKTPPVITYSLRGSSVSFDLYYQQIAAFTDQVRVELQQRAGALVAEFQEYVEREHLERPRSSTEYGFELLSLGVLWQCYGGPAMRLGGLPARLLIRLNHWRRQSSALKGGIDTVRGILAGLYLTSSSGQGASRNSKHQPAAEIRQLPALLTWLQASGDFSEEARRLGTWAGFLQSLPPQLANHHLEMAQNLATWFASASQAALGNYTQNVPVFLENTHAHYRWREDHIFCSRERVEYHLAMVGTEILNRAYRAAFLETRQRLVLLPPCMKARHQEDCLAEETPYGERCAACTPGCRVHQATKLGEKHGFQVLVMPHELSVFASGEMKPAASGQIGVVGVSCPLTNVTGGWETQRLGVPAQGLLLDYCGCSWHWHETGIATDINFKQLLEVVGVDA